MDKPMEECRLCGAILELPRECQYCTEYYCVAHRLPENHACDAIPANRPRPQPPELTEHAQEHYNYQESQSKYRKADPDTEYEHDSFTPLPDHLQHSRIKNRDSETESNSSNGWRRNVTTTAIHRGFFAVIVVIGLSTLLFLTGYGVSGIPGAIDTVDEFSHSVVNDSDLYDRFANTGNGHQEAGSKNNEDTINPWGTETVTVSIRQEAQPDYNTTQVVQAGLAYWETNSETYTNHTISYELTQETEDSDIVIEFNTEIDSCGLHSNDSNIAGCADFIQDRAPSVTNVQVELVENEEFAVLILKHELGHTLGLTHTDAPQAIMNATSPVVPNQEQRLLLFDAYTDGLSHYANGSLDFDRGTNAFNEGKYTAAIDHYQKSSKDFERGINDFRVAQKTAVNSELPEAADVCESAIRSAEHFNAAAEAMIRASELASVDDPAANDKVNEATESLENAQAINMDDGTKLAEILGIQLQSN